MNFHHVRIPLNFTTNFNAPKLALQKVKSQSKNVYKTTIGVLKKNGNYSDSDSLTQAITQQSYDPAEDIATIAYSELDILERQLQSITMALPSATSVDKNVTLTYLRYSWPLFSLFNYINTPEYNEQMTRN